MTMHRLHNDLHAAHFPPEGRAVFSPDLEGHLFGWGPEVPAPADPGWAPGALFLHTAGDGIGTTAYVNNGTAASALFVPNNRTLLSANTAVSGNIGNTTDETAFNRTFTIPADALRAGDQIRIRAVAFVVSVNGTPNLTTKLKLGATALLDTGAVAVLGNGVVLIETVVSIRTVGAAGTLVATGQWNAGVAGTATTRAQILGSTAVDTTAAQLVSVTATWSAAHLSNVVRLEVLSVEKLSL